VVITSGCPVIDDIKSKQNKTWKKRKKGGLFSFRGQGPRGKKGGKGYCLSHTFERAGLDSAWQMILVVEVETRGDSP